MGRIPLASIVISSYNYGRFLREAINGALTQTYEHREVVVVDDGSTDESREIVGSYGARIKAILKKNEGQASAFNAGVRASKGEVLFFVDSDDVLLPTAVEEAMRLLAKDDVAKVHWPLWVIDEAGIKTGQVLPGTDPLPEGDLQTAVLEAGADGYTWPPTTGNCWSRRFVDTVFPLPEAEYQTCPDYYLAALAPLYGAVKQIATPLGLYRIHGTNHGWRGPIEERLEVLRQRTDHTLSVLTTHCRIKGLSLNVDLCRSNSWYSWLTRIYLMARELSAIIPPDASWILADEGKLENRDVPLPGRRPMPFPEHDGEYWGQPEDDETAVREFERLRQTGAAFMVFAWPAFWWLDYYEKLHHCLRARFSCTLANERVVVFDLRAGARSSRRS
jgi:glycosyltransferase involved in cell wall biosynthesis